MKRFGLFALAGILLVVASVFAQDSTKVLPPVVIPTGFNPLFIGFFVIGMLAHFVIHVKNLVGWGKLLANLTLSQLVAWFGNKFHMTLIAGAAAAIMGVGASWGLSIEFAVLTPLSVVVAIGAGYIGDSAFNGGLTPVSSVSTSPPK